MIREAVEKDLEDILEIYNDAILNTTALYTYKPQTLTEKKQWFMEKKKGGYPLYFTFSGKITKSGYKFGKWLDLVFYQLNLKGTKNPVED